MAFFAGPRVTSTSNADRTVTINDRMPKVLAQRPLSDLKETVGSGPWLKVTPTSYHELALSANGRLLAVAQERTIQIYDLGAEPDSFTVNEYISSAAGHYICGLDFEQNDHVLRVRLIGKEDVLYLGTPPVAEQSVETATIDHWKRRLSGLQLLRPWQDGFLFAAQKHGGNESSHYVLGHVKCSVPNNAHALTAEPESVTILARMESFLSAWDYTLNGKNETGMGLWENMPSAHEHHPSYALSPDGAILVLAERDKKAIRPTTRTQLFLYRLPNEQRMLQTLEDQEQKRRGRWATLSSFLHRLETSGAPPRVGDAVMSGNDGAERKHQVARIPLCLSTIRGAVHELKFDTHGAAAFALSASTTEAVKSWMVCEL